MASKEPNLNTYEVEYLSTPSDSIFERHEIQKSDINYMDEKMNVPDTIHVDYELPLISWDSQLAAPAFYSWQEVYPFLRILIQYKNVIQHELAQACEMSWPDWPESTLYDADTKEWKVFPFVHTFPANDPSRTTWVDHFCACCPNTTKLLRALPGIRTALFSRLGPGVELEPHQGWSDLSNHVLRCHFALQVPSDKCCGLIVDDEERYHQEGDIIVFDDSKTHMAYNRHPTQTRAVLIFDLARPPGLPLGTAEGGTTEQLDTFRDYFR